MFGAILLALITAELLAIFLPTDAAWGPLAIPLGETQTKLVWYTGKNAATSVTLDGVSGDARYTAESEERTNYHELVINSTEFNYSLLDIHFSYSN